MARIRLPWPFSGRTAWICLLAVAAATAVSPVLGQEGNRGAVFTDPPEDDPNFALQGEFVGPVSAGETEYEAMGLQIRSIGSDTFEGLCFRGGLPGQPHHQPEPIRLVGRRAGDTLVLSGGPWAIFVDPRTCEIIDRSGNRLGRLERIHRGSPTLGAAPPDQAIVLFDGSGVDQFSEARMTDEGLLEQGANILPLLQDFDMHVEFRLPYMPRSEGQSRGNSGIYLQSRYECQILDSFAQVPAFNGCGALYRFRAPDLNMCLPPLVWQTYDIRFTAPRWAADGSKLRNARISIWLNGVKVQDDVEVPDKTGAGQPENPQILPTLLQNHSDPVRFRNVWVIDRGLLAGDAFPAMASEETAPEDSSPSDAAPTSEGAPEATPEPEAPATTEVAGEPTAPQAELESETPPTDESPAQGS